MNKPLILVVEDDAPVRNLITTTLKANDYRFQTAANGEAGVLATASQNPDIILLDLGLPDMERHGGYQKGTQLVECSHYCDQCQKRGYG